MPDVQGIPLDSITIEGTQTRATLNEDAVADYAAAYKARKILPPLVVFHDGSTYWLGDGFHRFMAMRQLGASKPVRCDVRQGGRRDAIQFGFTANVPHGLRRTNEDKRHAVTMALADPEWENWSDHAVAELCGVTNHLVAKVRAEHSTGNRSQLTETQESDSQEVTKNETPEKRKGRDGKMRPAKKPREAPADEPTDGEGGKDAPPEEPKPGNPPGWDESIEAAASVERSLRDAIDTLKKFEETPASTWLMRVSGKSQVLIALEKAKQDIFVTRPSEKCGKCESGCDHCRGSGWLPKYMTTKNAKSAREA